MHLGFARALVPLFALLLCGALACGGDDEPSPPRDSAPERPPGCEGACAGKVMPQVRCATGALAVHRCGFSDVGICTWVDPRCPVTGDDGGGGDAGDAGTPDGGDGSDGASDTADTAADAPDDATVD
jgi:hypothetical protein